MRSDNWWMYKREDPYEETGRQIVDQSGVPFIVILPYFYWAYIEWLEERYQISYDDWLTDCEKLFNPSKDKSIKNLYESCIFTLFLRRERRGEVRPPWLLPARPEQLIEPTR